MELYEFDIRYEPRTAIKAHVLVDFLAEMVTLYVDGASSTKGSGADVILEKEGKIVIELLIKFNFSVSNNQAEYEALIAGLQRASNINTTQLTICYNSQIVTS